MITKLSSKGQELENAYKNAQQEEE